MQDLLVSLLLDIIFSQTNTTTNGNAEFLSKAVIPGRAFIRCMYNKLKTTTKKGAKLKNHYHVCIDTQFRQDCKVWKLFLENANSQTIARQFIDKHMFQTSEEIEFYSDASRSPKLGFGCVYGARYTWGVLGGRQIL